MSTKNPMTLTGKKKLEQELEKLIKEERPQVIQAIEVARGHGDLSENADYDAAKEKQAFVEARIGEIQSKLGNAEVVDVSKVSSSNIVFGAKVELLDCDLDKKVVYQIVGEDESDVKQGRISIFSPLSRSLIGKKEGDIVEVKTPSGAKEYEVLKITYK